MIRPVSINDAAAIGGIYNYYVANTLVTFEEIEVTTEEMANRIQEVTASFPWLVLEKEGAVAGYAYANRWKHRSAYRFTVESTVYLHHEAGGGGYGSLLYKELLGELRKRNFHSAVGCIALPNPGSVALHEKYGFRKVGSFKQVGWKFNQWVDVGYWELLL